MTGRPLCYHPWQLHFDCSLFKHSPVLLVKQFGDLLVNFNHILKNTRSIPFVDQPFPPSPVPESK